MTKTGVLACLKANNYTQAEVKRLIESIDITDSARKEIEDLKRPKYLKKQDVYSGAIGKKQRPVVIVKIIKQKNIVIGIPLTTTENEMCLIRGNSRFFGSGYFTNHFVTCRYDVALENFIGTFDNPKATNRAIKKLKEFLNNNI